MLIAQLLEAKSEKVLVDVYTDRLDIFSQDFKEELSINGITLPLYLADLCQNQRHFDFNAKDSLFLKAFSIYYSNRASAIGLLWKQIDFQTKAS